MAWHGHDKPFNVPGPLRDDSPKSLTPLYHSLFSSFPSPPHLVSRASLSGLLYDSLSLSAWKTTDFSTWSLRVNPSSGNLHPTKVQLLSPPFPDGDPPFSSSSFLAHYSPKDHSLELHAHLDLSSLFLDHGSSVLLLALLHLLARSLEVRRACPPLLQPQRRSRPRRASLGWDAHLLDGLGHDDLNLLLSLHRANPLLPSKLLVCLVHGRFL